MITHILGYPRIGSHRELKKATENYWAGRIDADELRITARNIRQQNRQLQKETGLDLIPSNDFSFYDQVLDTSLMVGAIPERYHPLLEQERLPELDLYFAMARGYQQDGYDVTPMEMTKWFDTNYHYIVPEFTKGQHFRLFSDKVIHEFEEASGEGYRAKPVLLGPVSYLLLGKEKEPGFNRLDLANDLTAVYLEVLGQLDRGNPFCIQLDEPCLCLDLDDRARAVYQTVYGKIRGAFPHLNLMVATYFGGLGNNLATAWELPVQTLHVDLVRCPGQLDELLSLDHSRKKNLSLGIVDGRNIWKNNFSRSLALIRRAVERFGEDRIWLAPSSSLLHVPLDLSLETGDGLPDEVRGWMAFAAQKLSEVVTLAALSGEEPSGGALKALAENQEALQHRKHSEVIHRASVKDRVRKLEPADERRRQPFSARKALQQQVLKLPLFPATTIGSFPQTPEVRKWRAALKRGILSAEDYDRAITREIERAIRWQEDIGIDVLVHGEFERNDMVEYFGEQLEGFFFTRNGWVQSYGNRCVKPPIIAGDVARKGPMTVAYSCYAQSLTERPVKGMLTGPVTMLQWSFVRDDQPRSETCLQIACAIRDEVSDLEAAGIKVIQIDEPALREGLPLRKKNRQAYLDWAVRAFRVSASAVEDTTQIHTHMCYSEFNDIIDHIAAMDADVITIETSRSQMELLDAFAVFKYPNDIGPGIYDIHSPRVPSKAEMLELIRKAAEVIPAEQIWINPDCGLKTRGWKETKEALKIMMDVAYALRG